MGPKVPSCGRPPTALNLSIPKEIKVTVTHFDIGQLVDSTPPQIKIIEILLVCFGDDSVHCARHCRDRRCSRRRYDD